ncbi:zinc finger CCCH domain-containing protein 30 [Tanacetum coccineum]
MPAAASTGSSNAVDAVKLLLAKGADPNMIDANGLRPVDYMIVDSPKLPELQKALHKLLKPNDVLLIKNARNYTNEFMILNGGLVKKELCLFAHKQEELRYVGSPSSLKPPLAPSGNRMLNWQQTSVPTLLSPGTKFQSSRLSDPYMSNFNPFQSMSPQSSKEISPLSARGLNFASDYQQHQQP